MAVPSISTYSISNGSHRYGSIGGAAVMTSPSDSVTKVSAIISQTSGGAAIETVETTVKTSSDQFADRWALSWPTTGITSSPYYVKMWATNADGNGPTREAAPYIYFPPTVAITSPANGSTLASASVTMAWTASDPYGISAQRVTVLHGADVLLDEAVSETDTGYAVPSSVAFLDGEPYTFRVTARNGNGMEASADSTCAFSFDAPAAASVTIADDGATATIAVVDPHYSESGSTISVDGSAIADSFTVFGASTQDGTPTPSAPVAIESIEPQNLLDDSNVYNLAASGSNIASNASYRAVWCEIPPASSDRAFSFVRNTVEGNRFRVYGTTEEPADGVVLYNLFSTDDAALAGTFSVDATYKFIFIYLSNAGATISAGNIAIYEGADAPSTVIPYGYLGIKTKDSANVITTYPIDLQGNSLCSVPDGTRDELRIGERKVLVKRVGSQTFDGSESWTSYNYGGVRGYYRNVDYAPLYHYSAAADRTYCSAFAYSPVGGVADTWYLGANREVNFKYPTATTVDEWKAYLASNPVTIVYELAAPQEIDLGAVSDMPFIPEDGEMWVDGTEMEASLRPADYAGQPPISSVDIARVNPDGTWTLAQGVTEGQSAIDPLPPLGVAYRYALTSHAAGGGMKVAYAEHTVETRAWHLNFGDAAQEHVSYLYNPQATMTLAQGGESYHFADGGAGRGLPVFYPTTDRDMSGTLRFDTVLYGDSDILLDLCDRYPVAWLRDPFGHRWRAHVRPSVSHGVGQVWPVAIAWDAVRFEEV